MRLMLKKRQKEGCVEEDASKEGGRDRKRVRGDVKGKVT